MHQFSYSSPILLKRRFAQFLTAVFLTASQSSASEDLPNYLRFSGDQCPSWITEEKNIQRFLVNRTGNHRYSSSPFRLDDTIVLVVNGVRYALPLGHQAGKSDLTFYEEALSADGVEVSGIYGLQFWMPSLRYPEAPGNRYQRHCEAGREAPGPDEYTIVANVLPMNTPAASELRMERLRWLDRTEDALSAELEDVISGKSQEHSGRLVQGIGDVIVYDGLSWIRGVEETDPSSDALEYASLRAWDGELFAVIRCTAPSIAARSDRVRASYEPCRSLSVGPLDPASDLPEMTYSLPRRSLADWSEVYWKIIKLMGDWRMTRD